MAIGGMPYRRSARVSGPAEIPAVPSGLMVPGLLLAATAAGLTAAALSAASPSAAVTWGSVALAAWCTALLLLTGAVSDYEGLGLAAWRIGPWSLVWGALAFGLATVTWNGPQYGAPGEILPSSVLRALWLTAVAFTMLAAGYCAGPFRLAGRPALRLSGWMERRYSGEIRSAAVPWVLFAVGIAAQAASAATTGHFGYVGSATPTTTVSGYAQYIALAGECVPLAVMAAAVRFYRTRVPGSGLTLCVLLAGAVAAGALGGNKQNFVVAVLAVVIPRSAGRRLPAGGIIAAVAFFLLLVIPFNAAYRASARGPVTLTTGQAIAAAPGILGQVASSDLSPSGLGQSAQFLAVRIRTEDSPAIIVQRTPAQIPYASGWQLAEAPLLDVTPRILWPGKPVLDDGYQFSQQYFDLPAGDYTSSDVTPEGDLWEHGGWVPVIAGMLLLGCLIRVLDDMTDARRGPHGAFLVLLLFPAVVQAGDSWSDLLAGIPGLLVLWAAVVAFSFRRRSAS